MRKVYHAIARFVLRLFGVPLVRVVKYEVTQTGPDDFHVNATFEIKHCATDANLAECRRALFAKVCGELGATPDEVEVVRSQTKDIPG